jgi:hypothetical protein
VQEIFELPELVQQCGVIVVKTTIDIPSSPQKLLLHNQNLWQKCDIT